MNRHIKLNKDRSLLVPILLAFILVSLKFCCFKAYRSEDYQEVAFLLFVALFYIVQKYLKVGIPRGIFLGLAIFWLCMQSRIFIMREAGYYRGRVIIGKLFDDSEGYGARAIARGVKTIGRTYNLSGPSLIPFVLSQDEIRRWFGANKRPSLILSGSTGGIYIEYPLLELYAKIVQDYQVRTGKKQLLWMSEDLLSMRVQGYGSAISIPLPPLKVKMNRENPNVMNHYIGWLSGYFHPDYVSRAEVRQDTISEASRINGPWKQPEPKALSKFLKSMEDVFELYPDIEDVQLRELQGRLSKSIRGLPHGELYSSILSLRALLYLLQGEERVAKIYFRKLANDKTLSERHREIAAKNLGVLEVQ